jgi:CRISPR-associated endonuclease/helicase Cas3
LHRHERGDRDKPVLYVHIPKDTDKPTSEWYADAFPIAKWVYRDVALLWRTKEILKKQKRLKMPEEARLLIESVFSNEETIKVPDVLNSSEDEAWGKMMADKSQAEFNKLNFDQGYCQLSSNRWDEEERIPTRLSEETNTLYLCRWEDGAIIPLYNTEKDFMWDVSSLSLRRSALNSIDYSDEIQSAINTLKTQRRFKYDTLFIVFNIDKMELTGNDVNGKEVMVSYSPNGGLLVNKLEGNR